MEQAANILVVDDEPTVRDTLGLLLQRRGYAVELAADGSEALAQLCGRPFEVAVIDLLLPGMDGLELARQARARQPDLSVLLLTGAAGLKQAPPEVDAYLHKTASPQEVLACIADLVVRERMALA